MVLPPEDQQVLRLQVVSSGTALPRAESLDSWEMLDLDEDLDALPVAALGGVTEPRRLNELMTVSFSWGEGI